MIWNKIKKKAVWIVSAGLVIVAIILPFVVNAFLKPESNILVGFLGGYLGSIVGVCSALIALYATYKQNEAQHASTREEMREQNRLQVLPYISVSHTKIGPESVTGPGKVIDLEEEKFQLRNEYINIMYRSRINSANISNLVLIRLNNVGVGTAVKVKLGRQEETAAVPIEDLFSKGDFSFYMLFPQDGAKYNFILQFSDTQSRSYQQFFNLEYKRTKNEAGSFDNSLALESTGVPEIRQENKLWF